MALSIRKTEQHVCDLKTRMPFRYGIANMTAVPHLFLSVTLRVDHEEHTGVAADHLPPKWFTKNPDTALEDDIRQLRRVIDRACDFAVTAGDADSVFDLWRKIHARQKAWGTENGIAPLLWGFGVSLVERATIDAFCRARQTTFAEAVRKNTFGARMDTLYDTLDGVHPADILPEKPLSRVIARHTVGLGDPLTDADIPPDERVSDGLPQSLAASIKAYGLTHFKIKLFGKVDEDRQRLSDLARIIENHTDRYAFTLDGNENYRQVEPFRRLWLSLADDASLHSFMSRLLFVEQPFHRDIALSPDTGRALQGWTDRPPIIIDESDGGFGDLEVALECGYVGTSHKNCKGVFKGLANAGYLSRMRRLYPEQTFILSAEDLSNIGPVALLQDLAVVASLGVESVERNGHHYFRGQSMFPEAMQKRLVSHHPDLYRWHEEGYATLDIQDGFMSLDSIIDAPFGVDFMPDFETRV